MNAFYDYEHVVTLEETNVVGNVYFVNHIRWQGHCRERFLEQFAPAILGDLRGGLALATVRCTCDYFAELEAFDRVIVRMRLEAVRQNRILLTFEYFRSREGGLELVARGEQQVASMRRSPAGLVPAPVPPYLRDLFERLEGSPSLVMTHHD